MENIKKIYKYADKCNDQQHYKAIIEAAMLSTIEIFNDISKMSFVHYVTVKNTSARKSSHLFTEVFD